MAYFLFAGADRNPLDFDIKVNFPLSEIKLGKTVPSSAITGPIRIRTRHTRVPEIVFFQDYYAGISVECLRLFLEFCANDIDVFPIAIVSKSGAPLEGQYFYLNVLAFRDGLIIDDTNSVVRNKGTDAEYRCLYHEYLKVRKSAVSGAHIWHDTIAMIPNLRYQLYLSDALQSAAVKRGLKGFDHAIKLAEV